MAIGVSALLGMYLLLGLLFSIQDLDNTINSATGEPVAQIFLDCVGEDGAIVLMVFYLRNSKKRKSLIVYPSIDHRDWRNVFLWVRRSRKLY